MTSTATESHRIPSPTPCPSLRPGTALFRSRDGWVVRTAEGAHLALHLHDAAAHELVDRLTSPGPPDGAHGTGGTGGGDGADLAPVIAALVEAGVVAAPAAGLRVVRGALDPLLDHLPAPLVEQVEPALRAALRERLTPTPGPTTDAAPDVVIVLGGEAPADGLEHRLVHCLALGDSVWVTPPAIRPRDLVLRHRAAHLQLDHDDPAQADPALAPLAEGPSLQGAAPGPGHRDAAAHLVAAHLAAVALRVADGPITGPAAHRAVRIDLRRLAVSEHVVVPVPVPPE